MSRSYIIPEPPVGYKFTTHSKTLDVITNRLIQTNGMCPCTIIEDEDHKCHCIDFREKGICRCGLYVEDK